MSAAEKLRGLPDDYRVYVPSVGEVTVCELVRARTEESPAVDAEWEATRSLWAHKVTVHLCEPSCLTNPGDGVSEGRASTA